MIPVPQLVLESLARSYGTTADLLHHFAGGREASDGILYAYPYEQGQRLLKIMAVSIEDRERGLLRLEERLRFMRFLGEHGAHIAFPQISPQGNLYETFPFEQHVWVGYSMEIAPGRGMRGNEWSPALFRAWGQTIGMLHRLARQYPSWRASVDPTTGEKLLTWIEEWEAFNDWCQDDQVRKEWGEIKRQLGALPVTREAFGFIHNDPHIWNLLVEGDRITVLDFDVANHHWFVNDIAIACQSVLWFLSGGLKDPVHHRDRLYQFLDLFIEGYEREYHVSPEWLDRLDLFISYRRILLFTVMHDSIRSQPDLHRSWKKMILSRPEVVGAFSATARGR